MTKKNVLIGIIAGVVAIALIVGGWFLFAAKSTPEAQVGPDGSSSAQPSAGASAQPSASAPATPLSDQQKADAKKQVEDSRKFEDVKAVANFSKEDVQAVLKDATEYTYAALTNTNLLSGQWAKNGKNMNAFAGGISQYFSADMRKQITSITPDDPKFGTKTQTLAYYVVPGDKVVGSPACTPTPAGGTAAPDYHGISCPGPLKISDMKYDPTNTNGVPGVMVTYSAEMDVPLVLTDGNKDVYQHVKYDFKLNFVRNKNYQSDATDQKFVIDYYDNNVNFGKVLG